MEALNLNKITHAYFLGIGGIGMSAIARYFNAREIKVSGYDKTPSALTDELIAEGIGLTFDDSISAIPDDIINNADTTLFVLTPAIPVDHPQWNFIVSRGWKIHKRSEVLGLISADTFCIAVAGTHGKTTTSTLIAHILYHCNINFTAFLGGISANYNSNYLVKENGTELFDKKIVVLEADEFDRSFHRLSPDVAVITAMDPDHLDIYNTAQAFFEAFFVFASKIKPGGSLVLNSLVNIDHPKHIHTYTYGLNPAKSVQFRSHFDGIKEGYFKFSYHSEFELNEVICERELHNIAAGLPGFHNIENATAAIAVCMDLLNLEAYDVKDAIRSFAGAKRRFEFIIRKPGQVVIDDYAHHPQELDAIISSVKELYPNLNLTAIFQPHLFSRTRDFADGFARSLSAVDEIVLMDIYPARELPIEGINSTWLLDKINIQSKSLLSESAILQKIKAEKPELLLILGAGDIDRLVPKVKEVYEAV
jgi:UDP-N-acetylmuramate--alanine ligase